MCECKCIFMYINIHVYTYIYIHIYVYMYSSMYIQRKREIHTQFWFGICKMQSSDKNPKVETVFYDRACMLTNFTKQKLLLDVETMLHLHLTVIVVFGETNVSVFYNYVRLLLKTQRSNKLLKKTTTKTHLTTFANKILQFI